MSINLYRVFILLWFAMFALIIYKNLNTISEVDMILLFFSFYKSSQLSLELGAKNREKKDAEL